MRVTFGAKPRLDARRPPPHFTSHSESLEGRQNLNETSVKREDSKFYDFSPSRSSSEEKFDCPHTSEFFIPPHTHRLLKDIKDLGITIVKREGGKSHNALLSRCSLEQNFDFPYT